MAGRVILQVDKTTLAHQGFLWNFRECGKNTSLDCRVRIYTGGYLEEMVKNPAKSLHYFTGFERQPISERTAL